MSENEKQQLQEELMYSLNFTTNHEQLCGKIRNRNWNSTWTTCLTVITKFVNSSIK